MLGLYVTRACWVNSVGSSKSQFTPYVHCALKGVVLASPIPGSMSVGRQATQLTHKQLKYTKSRHPGEPWMHMAMMNKERTLPSMFDILTPQGGTGIAETKSLWPNLPKPKLEPNSPVLCINPFIFPPIYISSMTVTS